MVVRPTPIARPVASPCTGVCTIDVEGLCLGCARTLDEIAGWSTVTAAEREAIMAALPARREGIASRRRKVPIHPRSP